MTRHRIVTLYPGPARAQSGAVLVTSLVILLVMTLVGVTAMNTSILEEKMAGNLKERNQAFQAAEASLRDAFDWIEGLAVAPNAVKDGTTGVWLSGSLGSAPDPDLFGKPENKVAPKGFTEYGAAGAVDLPSVTADPRYGVEEFQFIPDTVESEALAVRAGVYHYAVTAVGFGGTLQSQSMLQCYVGKRYR